jgi:hypothetical protein
VNVREGPGRTLVVETGPDRVAWFLLAMSAGCGAWALWLLRAGRGGDALVGSCGAALTLLLAALLMFEQARFEFDGTLRRVRWHRRRSLSRSGGVIPFASILGVDVQELVTSRDATSRRVVLRTRDGVVPITLAYGGKAQQHYDAIAERIRAGLGLAGGTAEPATPPGRDDVRELVRAGRIVEAVKLLRERERIPLAEARARVDALRAQRAR